MSRIPRLGRATRVLLGLAAALAIGIALFDWNWFRHDLERYLAGRSNREVRIGHLDVDLGLSLEPTIHLRDLYIENAPWAARRPFVNAKEATFTVSLRSLWEHRPVISKLVLVDAEVDMERQADGLRNWRLRNPQDRGPGRVKVLRLEPQRTQIRFVNRAIDLDFTAAASPAQGQDAEHPMQVDFKGEFEKKPFTGKVATAALLTFLETGESFPMRGHAASGKTRLEVDGTVADLFSLSAIDTKMSLAGASLQQIHPFLRTPLPASRPYAFEARLRYARDHTSFTGLHGKVGDSDLAGEFSIDRTRKRPVLRARLHSESADLRDLQSLAGAQPAPASDAPPGRGASVLIFSPRAFDGSRLTSLDAHVTLDAKKLTTAEMPALESLKLTAALEEGVLALKPIDIGLAGGHLVGEAGFDGRHQPLSSHASMDIKDVRLEKLFDTPVKGAGPLQGRFDLKGRGDSVAKALAGASGSVRVTMAGGEISNKLDAKIGLNVGRLLRLAFTGDRAVVINSAEVAFDFDAGRGKSKAIVLDTEQTRTEGAGSIDLREETIDVLLTPQPKKGVLTLQKSIRVHGALKQPGISLAGRE